MGKSMTHYSAEQKAHVLRQHFVQRIPVNALCHKYEIAPALFYQWQRQLFENGAVALAAKQFNSLCTMRQQYHIAPLDDTEAACARDVHERLENVASEHTSITAVRTLANGLGLTRREGEVLYWLCEGKTNAEIATLVGARPRTVGKHLEHVFVNLGVESRTAAVGTALRALVRLLP